MSSRSLLDALDEISPPIVLAQKAVSSDDVQKLREILLSEAPSKQISECTYVNPQDKENLLHFAVHQAAGACAALLVNRPFCWSPDRPNLIGRSAVQIAQTRAYLPVWYCLAATSNKAISSDSSNVLDVCPRTIAALLLYPHLFIKKPFQFAPEILNGGRFGEAVFVLNKSGTIDDKLTLENIVLLFELLLATPEVVLQSDSTFRLYNCFEAIQFHGTECDVYPGCLKFAQSPQEMALIWISHRMRCCPQKEKEDLTNLGPLKLYYICRAAVRRIIATKLVKESENDVNNQSVGNYAKAIAQLPLPASVREFLAYRELWPALERHKIQLRTLHGYRIRSLPEPINIWFPI